MKTRKRNRFLWFRRHWAPTAILYRSGLIAIAGVMVFALGGYVSFKRAFGPLALWIAQLWNSVVGSALPDESVQFTNHILGGVLMLGGAWVTWRAIRRLFRDVVGALNPRAAGSVHGAYRQKAVLASGPKIVALGGGTGLSTLLRGLKQHSSNITAIVTVTDDGGSSGRLVKEMGMIPPGDLRNCLVALADAEKMMTDLFQHRFTASSGALSGHSLGNLFIAGLVDQTAGDIDKSLLLVSEVLAIRGRVVPSTKEHVRLKAIMEDDSEIVGETAIVESDLKIRRIFLTPDTVAAHPDALEAIRNADLIAIGPGSVYTSVIPNLLVPGIAEALRDSDAVKAYICNVMTQPGESESFTAAEHLVAVQANVPCRVFDYVLVNTGVPSEQTLERYRESDQEMVVPDTDRVRQMGFRPVTGNFMSDSDFVRHDPLQLASRLMDLLYR